jgi:hypothetical protein
MINLKKEQLPKKKIRKGKRKKNNYYNYNNSNIIELFLYFFMIIYIYVNIKGKINLLKNYLIYIFIAFISFVQIE